MTRILDWLRDMFTRPEVEPFVPEEDPFVQRSREAIEASKERQSQRRKQRRNALERELIGRPRHDRI